MKKLNLLLILSFSFGLLPLNVFAQTTTTEEPAIAVIVKSKKHKVKQKPQKKPHKIKEQTILPPKPEAAAPVAAPAHVAAVKKPAKKEEAVSRKQNLKFSFGPTIDMEKSNGVNQTGGNSHLGTPWSLGLLLDAEYYVTEDLSVFVDCNFINDSFSQSKSAVVLTQNGGSSTHWNFGVNYIFSKYFYAGSYFGFKQDYGLYLVDLNHAVADEFWHGLWGVSVGYHIWHNKMFSFDGATGFDVYFPTTKAAYSTSTGDAINTDVKITFKSVADFFFLIKYEFSQLRISTFTGQTGHLLQFGLGVDLNSKVIKND